MVAPRRNRRGDTRLDQQGRQAPERASPGNGLGHSTNLVGVPTGLLASIAFNDYPVPLHIAGVREMNRSLFEMLSQAESAEEAAWAFEEYMGTVFGLDVEQRDKADAPGKRRFRSSYLRLLKGWGWDSNGPEGAVMKGWVESLFGLSRPITRPGWSVSPRPNG